MTEWEKTLKRKSDGLGFISRLQAWKDPTPEEWARAIMIETESWQKTKGKKITQSLPYSTPIYKNMSYGLNTKATRNDGQKAEHRKEAMAAYLDTPINIGKETWLIMDWWTAIKHWLKRNKVKLEEKK